VVDRVWVAGVMVGPTRQRTAMGATAGGVSWLTRLSAPSPSAMHGAEARSRQGGEDHWMMGHRRRDAFASQQSSTHHHSSVSGIGGRTRRAAGGPSGATGLEQHPVGLAVSRIAGDDLTGLAIDSGLSALQPDGVGAPAAAFALCPEAFQRVSSAGPGHHAVDKSHIGPISHLHGGHRLGFVTLAEP
jgi:hypothetical protein